MREYDETRYYHKHARHWRKVGREWDEILSMNVMKNWDSPQLMPESLVEARALALALECLLYGDRDHGDAFLRRALDVADRIMEENRCQWERTIAETGYPRNLAVVLRDRAYAKWLMGDVLDRRAMKGVARYLAEWCFTKALDHKRFHDSITMNFFLQAVRAAIIACDLDYAGELGQTKQPLRWHHGQERDLWKRLIEMYPDVTDEFDAEFEAFFDLVRDPDFQDMAGGIPVFINRDILALETGIIREMYIVHASPLDPADPEEVLRAVAR